MGIIKEITVSKKSDPYFFSAKVELYHYDKIEEEATKLKELVDRTIHEWIVGPREEKKEEQLEETPQERKEKDYDIETQKWYACPLCGNLDIDYISQAGNAYQACKKCGIFLNDNGTTTKMRN